MAQMWDLREQSISTSTLRVVEIVEVQPVDSQYVGGLLELYPTPNWVNIYAAEYYGIKEIHATLGW